MKFFTFWEFLNSVFAAMAFGSIFGCVYNAAENILRAAKMLIFLLPNVILRISSFSPRKIKAKSLNNQRYGMSFVTKNIFDFFIVTFFGFITVLLYYTVLDGLPRLYFIVILTVFFLLAKHIIGNGFTRIFNLLFDKVYFGMYWLLSVALFPIYMAARPLTRIFIKLLIPIFEILNQRRCKAICKRKICENKKFIEKTCKKWY